MSRRPRPIRIGLQIAQYGAEWPAFRAAAREAEALGADALFNWDHFFGPRDSDVPSFECWTILGLGSGFKERDYLEYGYPFGSVASRVDDLESGVRRIRRRLELLNPPPVRPIPLLVAGSGERRTLRLVRWRDEHDRPM